MVLTAAGLDEEDDMFAPVMQSARRRWLWLGVNLITALLAAVVLYAFQPTLDELVELAVSVPNRHEHGRNRGYTNIDTDDQGYGDRAGQCP